MEENCGGGQGLNWAVELRRDLRMLYSYCVVADIVQTTTIIVLKRFVG
jgi:hypothetical protein